MTEQAAFERAGRPGLSTPDTRAHLICMLDGGFYGIDVHKVRQVGVLGKIWRLPGVPAFVKGVTRVRDLLIPLVDLRCKLGLPEADYHRHTVVVVADVSPPIAVVVDSVERVACFDVGDIQPIGRVGEKAVSRAVTGCVNWEDRTCLLLDLESILLGGSRAGCEERPADVKPARLGQSEESTSTAHVPTAAIAQATVSPAILAGTLPPGTSIGDGMVLPSWHGERTCPGFTPAGLHRAVPVLRIMDSSTSLGNARLFDLLARPTWLGSRRVPGFRLGEPRLFALAVALLQMPTTFQTKEAHSAVAALLGCSLNDYRTNQFRYDLNKFRARHLAERIGHTRRYRLTGIGRAVCEAIRKQVTSTDATTVRADRHPPSRALALSA